MPPYSPILTHSLPYDTSLFLLHLAIQHTIKTQFPTFVPAQANREDPAADIIKFLPPASSSPATSHPSDKGEKEFKNDECVPNNGLLVSNDGLPYLFPGDSTSYYRYTLIL